MEKNIKLKNISLVEKDTNNVYSNVVKNINFELNENEVVSFITPNKRTGVEIANILTNTKKPSSGELELNGSYFGFGFPNNRISRISKKWIKKKENSSKTVQAFLNEGMKDKRSLKKIYSQKLNVLKDEYSKNEALIKQIKNKKGYKKYFNNEFAKMSQEWIIKNNYHLSKQALLLEEIDQIDNRLLEINKEIISAKVLKQKSIDNNLKLSKGKHKTIIKNVNEDIEYYSNLNKAQKKEHKKTVYKSKPNDLQLEKIAARLRNEAPNLIKVVQRIKTPGYNPTKEHKNIMKGLEMASDNKKIIEACNSFVLLLKKMQSFVNEDIINSIDIILNYIENITDHTSALNSETFNIANDKITSELKTKITYYKSVIEDIEEQIEKYIAKDKTEKSPSKRKLWESYLLSLRFQKQIYSEKIHVIISFQEEIIEKGLIHNWKNMNDFYSSIVEFYTVMKEIDLSLNSWRLKRNNKTIVLNLEISISDFLLEEKKLKERRKEIDFVNREIFEASVKASTQEFVNRKRKRYNSVSKIENQKLIESLRERNSKLKKDISEIKRKIFNHDNEQKELELTYLLDDISFNSDLLNNSLSSMSESQLQRLSIIKSVLEEHEIIILESPKKDTSAESKTSLSSTIKNISKKYGVMIIVFTNDINGAYSFSDRVAFLHNSTIIEYGRTSEIMNEQFHPNTREIIKKQGSIRFANNTSLFNHRNLGVNLYHNIFSELKFRDITSTHKILAKETEYQKWK